MNGNGAFAERYFHSQDDLPIYYRDYGDPLAPPPPVLCLTGLTRNSRDFAAVASRLAAGGRRVLCMDYRGRGKSGFDREWMNYRAQNYASDVKQMLTAANIHRVVVIGTSLGGLVAMVLGVMMPTALAGVVLNDIGPRVAAEGRARIAGYVGRDVHLPDYATGAARLREQYGAVFPGLSAERWLEYARATFIDDTERGGVRLNYDMNLGRALRAQANELMPDLWALYRSLRHVPVLAIRGKMSDVLDAATFDRMAEEKSDLTRLTLDYRGHVPLLEEPECTDAIDRFLARV
jgi:pimeloyl-ACP methyl ester carboxylesterase